MPQTIKELVLITAVSLSGSELLRLISNQEPNILEPISGDYMNTADTYYNNNIAKQATLNQDEILLLVKQELINSCKA